MIIKLKEAKARLSELIQKAGEGDEVIITRHGQAVAKIAPIAQTDHVFRVNRKLLAFKLLSQKGPTSDEIIREDRDSRD